jgi:predicted MFS family arabinose efflux permease
MHFCAKKINTNDFAALENETHGIYPWIILICASFFFFYEFMQMNMMNAVSQGVIQQFGIDEEQFGKLAAYYAYANILFVFPAGSLLDRFSTRKIILVAMLICAGATFAFSYAQSLWMAKLCRFLTGIGGSFCFLSCIRLASRWFPPRHMALAAGVIVTLGMLGGAVAQAPLTKLVEHLGWRHALRFDMLLGLAIMVWIWMTVKDFPDKERAHDIHGHEVLHKLGFLHSMQHALSNRQNWLGGIYTSLVNLPIALLGAVFGTQYLQYAHGFDADHAASITMMIFVGTIFGGPLFGWFSDAIARRRVPMLFGAVISLILVLLVDHFHFQSFHAYMIIFFALGFITSSQVITYPLIAESNPTYLTATCTSVASMLILTGYAVFQPLFGKLMDHGQTAAHVFTAADFRVPMMILPCGFIVAFIAALFIKETNCKAVPEE